jgi:hypothetical protein
MLGLLLVEFDPGPSAFIASSPGTGVEVIELEMLGGATGMTLAAQLFNQSSPAPAVHPLISNKPCSPFRLPLRFEHHELVDS